MEKTANTSKSLLNSEVLMSQETIERRFEVGSPARLKLSNIRGPVDIQVGNAGIIEVAAVKHLDSGNQDQTEVKIEQAADGRVIVKTEYFNSVGNWFGINKPCKVDCTLRVPEDCDVRASGVSSQISVKGLNGDIDISTVSGKLTCRDLSGQLKLGTVSGSIQAERLSGELEVNGVSGRVRIMESKLSQAFIKTVSGSMVLQTPLAEGPYTFKGVSGRATLVIPEDTACSASFHSVSGRMRTSLPLTKDNRRGSRGSFEIQGGGANVTYKCVSGALKIVTTEDEKIIEGKAVLKPQPAPKNQMDVLQKIERGEISVDEALQELNGA
jgi:hypothetical protein